MNSIEILERTPHALHHLLNGISDDWVLNNEGPDTWSVFDVIGHLIHGEKTDWMNRIEIILSDSAEKNFTPFDRFAQFENSKGKSIGMLLDEFIAIRNTNLEKLRQLQITAKDAQKTGIHPAFGEVRLSQLMATWVVHDLNHIAQIARIMAKQYEKEVGPWVSYLKILQ
jgi:DinB superfamily